jgi:hypothetical protein
MAKTSKMKGFDGLDEGENELDAQAIVGRYVEAAKRRCAGDGEARLSEGAL